MKDVRRVVLRKDSLQAFSVAEIARYKSRLPPVERRPTGVSQNATDNIPAFGMKKAYKMGPNKAIRTSNKSGFPC